MSYLTALATTATKRLLGQTLASGGRGLRSSSAPEQTTVEHSHQQTHPRNEEQNMMTSTP